ncbi:Conserved_hypothetical protein [Hexamita inflata]|uniref:Uncharacterized protein n=1 Tax=Hexamita inflata TaxID=28002 RepID=A0AA86PSB5_9EUKA|nr:Conserved hypothetical protein [Hexamita inflata]
MQLTQNPNQMDRINLAACMYGDDIRDKYQKQKSVIPKQLSQTSPVKEQPAEFGFKVNATLTQINNTLQDIPVQSPICMKGKNAPVTFKLSKPACLPQITFIQSARTQFNNKNKQKPLLDGQNAPQPSVERPPQKQHAPQKFKRSTLMNDSLQSMNDTPNDNTKESYKRYIVETQIQEEHKITKRREPKEPAFVQKLKNSRVQQKEPLVYEQSPKVDVNDLSINSPILTSPTTSPKAPSTIVHISTTKPPASRVEDFEQDLTIQELDTRIQPSPDISNYNTVVTNTYNSVVKQQPKEQIDDIILENIMKNFYKVKQTLDQHVTSSSKTQFSDLEILKRELLKRKTQLIAQNTDELKQFSTELYFLRQYRADYLFQKGIKEEKVIQVDPNLLKQLQHCLTKLQSSFCLWVERGAPGCQACMSTCGLSQQQISTNMQKLNDIPQSTFDQAKRSISQQIARIQQHNELYPKPGSRMQIQVLETAGEFPFVPSSKEQSRQNNRAPSQPLAEYRFVQNAPFRTKSQLKSKINSLEKTELFQNQDSNRFVLFPCGDSVCELCLEGDQCPVCFGPVIKVVRSGVNIQGEEFVDKMKGVLGVTKGLFCDVVDLIKLSDGQNQ